MSSSVILGRSRNTMRETVVLSPVGSYSYPITQRKILSTSKLSASSPDIFLREMTAFSLANRIRSQRSCARQVLAEDPGEKIERSDVRGLWRLGVYALRIRPESEPVGHEQELPVLFLHFSGVRHVAWQQVVLCEPVRRKLSGLEIAKQAYDNAAVPRLNAHVPPYLPSASVSRHRSAISTRLGLRRCIAMPSQ